MPPSTVIRLQPAFDDPEAVRSIVEGAGPYVPLALTAQSEQERIRTGVERVTFIPPWFRRDLATHGEAHVDGAELLLRNPHFVRSAAHVFADGAVVEPSTVYVNVMGPAPYPFIAHIDIPVFRHASRRNCPVWLLGRMLASRLFESERVRLATAVSWMFDGPGGEFHYWPDGPEGVASRESPPFDNVAVVADNEQVYHGVGQVGVGDGFSPTELTIDAVIDHDAEGTWTIRDPDPVVTYDPGEVRITISWKAEVFADEAERDATRAAVDDPLPVDAIVARFMDDLRSKGLDPAEPTDPLHDPAWMAALDEAYPSRAPRIPV